MWDAKTEARFWARVEKSDGCWVWTGAHGRYGQFWWNKSMRPAHRVLFEHLHGPIPHGLVVMHTCDITLCVRPDHLRLGTQRDNVLDMHAKGRHARQQGVGNGNARLSELDVRAIRAARAGGEILRTIAERYGVTIHTIHSITTGQKWRHLS